MIKADKTFIKQIKSLIKSFNYINHINIDYLEKSEQSENIYNAEQFEQLNIINNIDYIAIVKYVIFFISKILFAVKICGNEILCENYNVFLSNNVLNKKEMGIFKLYNSYNLNLISFEEKLYELIYENKEELSFQNYLPAMLYENLLTPDDKKILGQVYTPIDIIENMLEQAISVKQINKSTKFLDPSCGGGYFLIAIFNKLKNSLNFDDNNADILITDNLMNKDKYILENMIYGIDIDEFSIFLTKIGLLFSSSCTDINFNIKNKDFLTENFEYKFDIIIGNPPYIGCKHMDKLYKTFLKEKYSEVYYDKSDISYCFFKKSKEMLNPDGIISFITSRYFMEAMYADKLRNFLKNNFKIVSIIDYSGFKVFKSAMVSPAVITLSNSEYLIKQFSYVKYNSDQSKIDKFTFNQDKLKNNGWIILQSEEEALFSRIENVSNTYIKNVCSIKQGIITGLDKAFIVTEQEIEQYNIERFLLKKWIKNSNISKDSIKYNNLYLIYTNIIEEERDSPNAIKYLTPFKEYLMNRRECKNGFRKWYELQWGREISDYENPKIVFPYKSYKNNFFYDKNEYFCSADIYIINELNSIITYDYLQSYLNSTIFEFYFKCQAKKVGVGIYEYYPNKLNLMKLYLPNVEIQQKISFLGKFSIEYFLKKVFNIGEEENQIINKFIFREGDDAD